MSSFIATLFSPDMEGEFMPDCGLPISLLVILNEEFSLVVRTALNSIIAGEIESKRIPIQRCNGFDKGTTVLIEILEKLRVDLHHLTVYHQSILSDNTTYSTSKSDIGTELIPFEPIELEHCFLNIEKNSIYFSVHMKSSCYRSLKLVTAKRTVPIEWQPTKS
jgi:hypothetical protein